MCVGSYISRFGSYFLRFASHFNRSGYYLGFCVQMSPSCYHGPDRTLPKHPNPFESHPLLAPRPLPPAMTFHLPPQPGESLPMRAMGPSAEDCHCAVAAAIVGPAEGVAAVETQCLWGTTAYSQFRFSFLTFRFLCFAFHLLFLAFQFLFVPFQFLFVPFRFLFHDLRWNVTTSAS